MNLFRLFLGLPAPLFEAGRERLNGRPLAGGGEGRLRFRRYSVTPDPFESRMEWTDDGSQTWKPGNHQVFVRR